MNKLLENLLKYAPDCKYVIILSFQSKISQFSFLRLETGFRAERYWGTLGDLRSGNVTWDHLRNHAICETKILFVSNTHQGIHFSHLGYVYVCFFYVE